jgi:hypothetical protein
VVVGEVVEELAAIDNVVMVIVGTEDVVLCRIDVDVVVLAGVIGVHPISPNKTNTKHTQILDNSSFLLNII